MAKLSSSQTSSQVTNIESRTYLHAQVRTNTVLTERLTDHRSMISEESVSQAK